MTGHLKAAHDRLRDLMRDFANLMAPQSPQNMASLMQWRVDFANLFRQHMSDEAKALATLEQPVLARHADALRALFLRYNDHIHNWVPSRIVAEWDVYRTQVLSLQQSYCSLMDWEEAEIYPLLRGGASA